MSIEQISSQEQGSNALRKMVLDVIAGVNNGYLDDRAFFNNETRILAEQNQSTFDQLLKQLLFQYPDLIFQLIKTDAIEQALGVPTIQETIRLSTQHAPEQFLRYLPKAFKYLPSDEVLSAVEQILTKPSSYQAYQSVLNHLDRPEFSSFISDLTKRELLGKIISESGSWEIEKVQSLMTAGILPKELVTEALTTTIQTGDNYKFYWALDITAALFSEFSYEERVKITEKVFNFYDQNFNPDFFFSRTPSLAIILGKPQTAILIEKYLTKSPGYFIKEISLYLKKVTEVVDLAFFEAWFSEAITKYRYPELFNFIVWYDLKEQNIFSEAFFNKYVEAFLEIAPGEALTFLYEFLPYLETSQHQTIIQKMIKASSFDDYLRAVSKIREYIPLPDEELIATSLGKLPSSPLDEILRNLQYSYYKDLLLSHLDHDVFIKVVKEKLIQQPYYLRSLFTEIEAVFKVVYGDQNYQEKIKEVAEVLRVQEPGSWLRSLSKIQDLYSSSDIYHHIDAILQNVGLGRTVFSRIEAWGNLLGPELTKELILKHAPYLGSFYLWRLPNILAFFPTEERAAFVLKLTQQNPMAAVQHQLYSNSLSPYLGGETAWDIFMAGDPTQSATPKLEAELRNTVIKNKDNSGIFERALRRGSYLKTQLGLVEYAGATDILHQLISKSDQSEADEQHCLDLAISYALLFSNRPHKLANQAEITLELLSKLIFGELQARLEITPLLSSQQEQTFLNIMGEATPFTTYFAQYEKSPAHTSILKEMLVAIANNEYPQWKYQSQTLSELQEAGLLPEQLSDKQYQVWQTDDSTQTFEALTVTFETVANKIRQTITDNAEHLYLEKALTQDEVEIKLAALKNQAAQIGSQIASLSQQFSQAKKQGQTEQTSIFQASLQELQDQNELIFLQQRLLWLAKVSSQEVESGYLIKDGKKFTSIADVLKIIKLKLNELEARGLLERDPLDVTLLSTIGSYLDELKDKGLQQKQKLSTTDSSSPKVSLEVGHNPLESCQDYAFGAYNECLLGFSDANTKILTISNEKGNIVARSILRLLTNVENGQPALHVETIYSTTASDTVSNLIYQHAIKKARAMGIKAYVSERAQNEQGVLVNSSLSEYFITKPSSAVLESFNSRAPAVYVDSAEGKNIDGKYQIVGVLELDFAPVSTLAESIKAVFVGK